MIKLMFAAIAALAAASATAQRAGPFDGPYIGVQGGYQQDRQRVAVADPDGVFTLRDRTSGFAYGGQLGFDYQLNPFVVVGLEASATGVTGDNRYNDGFGNDYGQRIGRTFNGTGRIGYLIRPDALAYVRGGYSNARFDLAGFGQGSEDRDGYTVGVGYEQAIARAVSARIEYNYSQYGNDNAREAAFDAGPGAVRTSYRRDAVMAGLNFHF